LALDDPPDLILSDVMMPGLNGFELVAALRRHDATRTIPVVLLSARAGEESRVEGLDAGADDYLVKPFTARELLARVGAHVAMHRRRREAELALQESQATLQSFYDSSPLLMGVAELDVDKIIPVYGNAATAAFFRIPSSQVSVESVRAIDVPVEVSRVWIEKYRESQTRLQPVQFEYEHPRNSGARWLRATATYLGLGPSGLPRFSFVAEDITERKRAEQIIATSNEELRRANTDLGQFAYSASHDLQEPLRQVAVYSQLLEKKYAAVLDGKGLQYLSHCVEGAHRMEMLISDLLAYSQATNTSGEELERVDLNVVVEEVTRNLATLIQETGTTLTVDPLPAVPGHPVPLGHLFQNLISNAIKYRGTRPARVKISAERQGYSWLFRVEDNGIGIPQQFQSQIFGIFKRLHDKKAYPGTGIGLAICQKVVERYGGRIWVESEDGEGSTFLFTLPNDAH
jgi:signal transduction histidine kinase